jgi:hypothetical protein
MNSQCNWNWTAESNSFIQVLFLYNSANGRVDFGSSEYCCLLQVYCLVLLVLTWRIEFSGCCCNVCRNGQLYWPSKRTGLGSFSRYAIIAIFVLPISYYGCSYASVRAQNNGAFCLMLSKRHQSDDLVYSSNLKVHFFLCAEHMLFMGSSEFPDENEVCTMCMLLCLFLMFCESSPMISCIWESSVRFDVCCLNFYYHHMFSLDQCFE